MNFTTVDKVTQTIRAGDEAEQIRADNRIKIQNTANSFPPLTPEQAKKMGLKINVNWGEMSILFAHARRQYDDAFLNTQNFFRVSIPDGPDPDKISWGTFITNKINAIMKRSESYSSEKESQHAALVAHGIGPLFWPLRDHWEPEFVAIEDFRVATDTKTSLKNLAWVAIRKLYTEGELTTKVFGRNSDRGWNRDEIKKILHAYHNTNYEVTSYDWLNAPEKMAELVKQNSGFYSSDSVPTIPFWHFYHICDADPLNPVIKLKVVPDLGVRGTYQNKLFLYESDKPVCTRWPQLLNIQFGDLNNKSPMLFHSVRSLGFLLMEPVFWMNLFRCRLLQHGMENFNAWLRVADPEGRARAQKVDLFDKGIVPEGVSIVPQTERHHIDPDLISNIMAQMKQLQQEGSQSYTQQLDTGTRKEQTAFETRAKMAAVNAMMSGLLNRAFRKEGYNYREICRRFCLRKSTDPDVQEFQSDCRNFGIPLQYLNVEYWVIEPEKPIGSGNPMMAESEISTLMEWRPMFDPAAQQEILHEAVEVITRDPKRADRWVPLDKRRGVTDAERDAEFAFGTLMQGVPVRMKEGLNPIEQIETLLGLLAGVMAQIERNGAMADAREIVGMQTTAAYVGKLVGQLAQDRNQKARVKAYSDSLGKLVNTIKGFSQRLQEAQASAAQNGDPTAAAKAQSQMMLATTKARINQAMATQKMRHKEAAFQQDQQIKQAQTASDLYHDAATQTAKRFAAFSKPNDDRSQE